MSFKCHSAQKVESVDTETSILLLFVIWYMGRTVSSSSCYIFHACLRTYSERYNFPTFWVWAKMPSKMNPDGTWTQNHKGINSVPGKDSRLCPDTSFHDTSVYWAENLCQMSSRCSCWRGDTWLISFGKREETVRHSGENVSSSVYGNQSQNFIGCERNSCMLITGFS